MVAVALLAGAAPPVSRADSARIDARPSASVVSTGLPAGISKLDHESIVYVPANLPPGPRPLLVLLHGMRGVPGDMVQVLKDQSDRRGIILLGLKSRDITWDSVPLKLRQRDARGPLGRLEFHSAADVRRMEEVLAQLFARVAVDPARVALWGFSDGASVALSMGIANPDLFPALIAMSPGFLADPLIRPGRQRVFIAHGERDPILSPRNSRGMADYLKGLGLDVRYRSFRGGHRMDRKAADEALDFAFGEVK